jgi:hypothetical protein
MGYIENDLLEPKVLRKPFMCRLPKQNEYTSGIIQEINHVELAKHTNSSP